MNNVTLVGNLTRDAEYKTGSTGVEMAKFSLACNRVALVKGEQKEYVDYVNVIQFGNSAQAVGELQKGEKVVVLGRYETRKYESKGETRYSTNVNAEVVGRVLMPPKRNPGAFSQFGIARNEEVPF